MSDNLQLPQHVLLKEEPEVEEVHDAQQSGQVEQQPSQSTTASSMLYEKQAFNVQNQQNNNINNVEIAQNNVNTILQGSTQSGQVIMLSIKQLSGETVQLPYNDQLKAMSISNLKREAFPVQFAQGYNIRFIYRGRLLGDGECLNNLQFIDQPIIHAQLNQPILLQDQQYNNTGDGQQQQQIQNGQISVEMQNGQIIGQQNNENNQNQVYSSNGNSIQVQLQEPLNQQIVLAPNQPTALRIQTISLEDEGTNCDFWFGLFLVLFLDLVGMIIIFCCQYSRKARKGAVIAFVIRCVLNVLFYNGDDQGDGRDR